MTIARAVLVARLISFDAPVVTESNTISSAALPARNVTSLAFNSSFDIRYFSSSGACITYPNEPIVLGTIVIFCTGSASSEGQLPVHDRLHGMIRYGVLSGS